MPQSTMRPSAQEMFLAASGKTWPDRPCANDSYRASRSKVHRDFTLQMSSCMPLCTVYTAIR